MSELATQASHWSNAAKMFATKAPTDIFSLDTLKLTKLEAHSKPVKVFDNGCGGGGLAAMIAEKFPNATVLATDFAPGMVEATKNRIQHLGLTNISAEVQDATSLTLESNQFDVVICQFTVMFLPNYEKGFSEMYRVSKEGGTCVIATWKVASTVTTLEDARLKMSPPCKIDHHVQSHPLFFEKEETLAEYATNAGFKDVEVTNFTHDIFMPVDMVKPSANMLSNPAVSHLSEGLSEEQKEQLLQDVFKFVEANTTEEGVRYHMVANILTATK